MPRPKGGSSGKISVDGQIARLEEALENYKLTQVGFEVGDMETPRAGFNMRGRGTPHIVLELRPDAQCVFAGEASSTDYGRRPDMRIAVVRADNIVTHWVESWEFEKFDQAADYGDHP